MRNFNRDSFFELLEEALVGLGEICTDHDIPNFEYYSQDEDEISDEDVKRIIECLKDISDIVKQNV